MKPINWHRSIPPISITGDPEPDFNRIVAASTVRLPDYVKPAEHEHVPVEPTEPGPLQKFFENYMNSSQLPRPIVEVRVGSGPQSVTNLLQYLYTKPAPLPAKPSGSSATYQQGNKKPVTTKDHH
jgi:hypothetical protein